jgi:hypothetical protein
MGEHRGLRRPSVSTGSDARAARPRASPSLGRLRCRAGDRDCGPRRRALDWRHCDCFTDLLRNVRARDTAAVRVGAACYGPTVPVFTRSTALYGTNGAFYTNTC